MAGLPPPSRPAAWALFVASLLILTAFATDVLILGRSHTVSTLLLVVLGGVFAGLDLACRVLIGQGLVQVLALLARIWRGKE